VIKIINTYNERDIYRVKVFFVVNNAGNVVSVKTGNQVVSLENGFQFYVDDYVAEQIDKCKLYMDGFTPKLKLKEGETIELPQKNEKEKEIERLEKELRELRDAE